MKKTVKVVVSVCVVILLAVGGSLLGYQHTQKVPLEVPLKRTYITLHVSGMDANRCAELVNGKIVANRLVENLMLLCTPDDLQASMKAESEGENTVVVEVEMEQEGQMAYLADELAWIVQDEAQKELDDVRVSVGEQKTLTISYEEEPSMMTACLAGVLGGVSGILICVLLFGVNWKSRRA